MLPLSEHSVPSIASASGTDAATAAPNGTAGHLGTNWGGSQTSPALPSSAPSFQLSLQPAFDNENGSFFGSQNSQDGLQSPTWSEEAFDSVFESAGVVASADVRMVTDLLKLMREMERYYACIEWLQVHSDTYRQRLNEYRQQEAKTLAEFAELNETAVDLQLVAAQLGEMRSALLRSKERFRRRWYCGY